MKTKLIKSELMTLELNIMTHQEFMSSIMSGKLEEGPDFVTNLTNSVSTLQNSMRKGLNYAVETIALLFNKKENDQIVLNIIDLEEEGDVDIDKVKCYFPRSLEVSRFAEFLATELAGTEKDYWNFIVDYVDNF